MQDDVRILAGHWGEERADRWPHGYLQFPEFFSAGVTKSSESTEAGIRTQLREDLQTSQQGIEALRMTSFERGHLILDDGAASGGFEDENAKLRHARNL